MSLLNWPPGDQAEGTRDTRRSPVWRERRKTQADLRQPPLPLALQPVRLSLPVVRHAGEAGVERRAGPGAAEPVRPRPAQPDRHRRGALRVSVGTRLQGGNSKEQFWLEF